MPFIIKRTYYQDIAVGLVTINYIPGREILLSAVLLKAPVKNVPAILPARLRTYVNCYILEVLRKQLCTKDGVALFCSFAYLTGLICRKNI